MTSESKCPFTGGTRAHTNGDWWPNQLNLQVLHQHSALSNPMGEAFDYAAEFRSLDLDAVIENLHALMTDSQEWGPPILPTTGGSSFGWHGILQGPTGSGTAAAAPEPASSASRRQ